MSIHFIEIIDDEFESEYQGNDKAHTPTTPVINGLENNNHLTADKSLPHASFIEPTVSESFININNTPSDTINDIINPANDLNINTNTDNNIHLIPSSFMNNNHNNNNNNNHNNHHNTSPMIDNTLNINPINTTNTAMSAMGEVLLNASKPPVNIKVVGVGGGGGNAVTHMIRSGVKNVTYITVNTDSQALYKTPADIKIQLGDNGQGAGANPNIARKYAEAARAQIKEALKGADMVFITAGLGKGTGTGASAVIAQVAQELEALTVCVVTKPFTSEGPGRAKLADAAADELEIHSDSIIVILNSKLEARNPDGLMKEWYQAADDVLKNAVATIVEVIQSNGYQNVDFRDVRSVIASNRGRALMGTARASGLTRAKEAASAVINCDLLEEENLRTARGVLINITAAEDSMRGREITEVIDTIRASFADDVTPIYGTTFDDSMGDDMQVTLIASGIGSRHKVSLADTSRAAMMAAYPQPPRGGDGLGAMNQPQRPMHTPVMNPNQAVHSPSINNHYNQHLHHTTQMTGLKTGTDDVLFNPSTPTMPPQVGSHIQQFPTMMTAEAFQSLTPTIPTSTSSTPLTAINPMPVGLASGVSLGDLANATPAPSIPTLTQEVDVAPPGSNYTPPRATMLHNVASQEPNLLNIPPNIATSQPQFSGHTPAMNGGVITDANSLMFNPSAMHNPKQESQKLINAMKENGVPNIDIPSFLRNQVN